MFTEFPYPETKDVAIHWDNQNNLNPFPSAVEIGDSITYFDENGMLLNAGERIIVARFLAGKSEASTEGYLLEEDHVPNASVAAGLIRNTFAKFDIDTTQAQDGFAVARRAERLVGQSYFTRTLLPGSARVPLPTNWRGYFRDIVLMLAAGQDPRLHPELSEAPDPEERFNATIAEIVEELGLAYLEEPGSALIALGADLLPDESDQVAARIGRSLNRKEKFILKPLSIRRPLPISTIRWIEAMPRPPRRASSPGRTTPVGTASLVIHPLKENRDVTVRFDGQLSDATAPDLNLGHVGLITIQGAEIEVAPDETYTQLELEPRWVAGFCLQALGLAYDEITRYVKAGPSTLRLEREKLNRALMGLGPYDEVKGTTPLARYMETLVASFQEETNLFRVTTPPQFVGLDREHAWLMEFGPHLINASNVRDIAYNSAAARRAKGNRSGDSNVLFEMTALRSGLKLSTHALAFLYMICKHSSKVSEEKN